VLHFLFIDISELSPGAAELVRCTRRALPDSCIIALAATTDEELVFHSIVAGARGYLVKPLCAAQLARTLQECGRGTPIFSPQAAAALVQRLHRLTPSRRVNSLSAREQEIADCLVAGYQDKDIARSLDISAGTVRSHLVNLFRKLEVHDRRAAIAKVVQLHASTKIGGEANAYSMF
jgi:DNA-binding NarL/FixJ family response regulator